MRFSKNSHKLIQEAMDIAKEKGFIEGSANIPGLILAIIRSEDPILASLMSYIEETSMNDLGIEVTFEDAEDSLLDVFKMESDYPKLRDLEIVVPAVKGFKELKIMIPKDVEDNKEENQSEKPSDKENVKLDKEAVDDIKKEEENIVSIPLSFVSDPSDAAKTNVQFNLSEVTKLYAAIEKGKKDSKAVVSKSKVKKAEETVKVVNKTRFLYNDTDGNEHSVIASESLFKVLMNFFTFEEDYGIAPIEPIHFLAALFYKEVEEVKEFFTNVDLSYNKAKKHFNIDVMKTSTSIPKELEGFLSILNDEIDVSKPCEILERDKEINELINILMKKNKRNAVIIGEAGVGKTALIEGLTYLIKSKATPEVFWDLKVVILDVNALIAGTSYRGDAEKRIENLISFLKKNKDTILFIDEVHTILGAGSCYEGEMDLANALKPILARGDTRVIGATTENEYEKYFAKDAALQRRFEKVEVEEPESEKVYGMIVNKIDALSEYHKVHVSKEMVENIILIANCFAFHKKNPDKTLDLIDRAMVVAKRNNCETVEKEHVRKNFAIFDELWENMDHNEKSRTAFHETGHYIVCKYSGRLVENTLIAVSILPAEGYLGVTVYERNKKKTPNRSWKYFVDSIAMDLAGRVAEEYLSDGEYTAGASQDLLSATNTARTVITAYGMGKNVGKNRIYYDSCDRPMFNDRIIDEVNKEIDELIQESMERAKEILDKNKDLLFAIQEALLQKHILSEKELDLICQETIESRKKSDN